MASDRNVDPAGLSDHQLKEYTESMKNTYERCSERLPDKGAKLVANLMRLEKEVGRRMGTEAAEKVDNSNDMQATTNLEELLQFDPKFQKLPRAIVKKGLQNIEASEWEKLQRKWKELQQEERELNAERSKLLVYSDGVIVKAYSRSS